ncbi:MAG TPA: hypothetical protein VIV63_00275, partial [Steroidobacteraceae bacterium]
MSATELTGIQQSWEQANYQAADAADKERQLEPDGMDPNYFIGELLYEKGEYSRSLQHLQKALAAPPR